MKWSNYVAVLIFLLIFLWWIDSTTAAQPTQTIVLNSGWNAVFLEVEPENPDAAVAFAPDKFTPNLVDPASIWKWNHRTSTVEFIQNPDVPVPEESQWMVYYTGDAPEYQFISNLHAIHGDTPYLIYISGGAVEWTISGEHTIPSIDWKPNSYNFVGFHLDEIIQTNYSTFFDASLANAGQKIYTLESGSWVEKTDTEFMDFGKAFWIYCKGSSEFTGPLSVQLEQGTGLHYGTTLNEQDLRILNNSTADKKTITLSLEASNVPFYYWVFDPDNDLAGWVPFPPDALSIAAGKSQKLRLGVKRAGLAADTTEKKHLTVTDNEGMTILIPVSVTGISYSGLWVGNTVITKVNEPANDNPNELFKTGSEFSFRLILHSEETGTVRLLSQVFQMWDEANKNYVLFTDDSLIPNYMPSALRDGQPVSRRISAPVLPILTAETSTMSGTALSAGGLDAVAGKTLSLTIILSKNDPTNPFMHRYNPDHIEPVFDTGKDEWNFPLERIFEITRTITMTFSDAYDGKPITGVPSLGWGSTEIGGVYHEEIGSTEGFTGLHKNTIHVEGTFLLHKVSNIGTLTQ